MQPRTWSADTHLDGFESTTLPLRAQDDGELAATLVRLRVPDLSTRAVVYVHGFSDYFFQAHVAKAFVDNGWSFYGLDLRRHGRSIRPGNRPNFCRDIEEYFEELSAAIDIVRGEEDHASVILMGHSTGGLIASLYANDARRAEQLDGVVLNSPFFEFSVPPAKKLQLPVASAVGTVLPTLYDRNPLSPRYFESISSTYDGEWSFDASLKPPRGFPVYYGWVHAVRAAQARVAKGISIPCPVLVLHGSHSMLPGRRGDGRHFTHDIVLNIADIRARSHHLGKNVSIKRIEGAIHDIFLSQQPVRDKALQEVFRWIVSAIGEKRVMVREFRT